MTQKANSLIIVILLISILTSLSLSLAKLMATDTASLASYLGQSKANYLAEEIQSAMCSGSYDHKVSLVLDGGNINDGTFNQLAYEGAVSACTAAKNCCLEVDRFRDVPLMDCVHHN